MIETQPQNWLANAISTTYKQDNWGSDELQLLERCLLSFINSGEWDNISWGQEAYAQLLRCKQLVRRMSIATSAITNRKALTRVVSNG